MNQFNSKKNMFAGRLKPIVKSVLFVFFGTSVLIASTLIICKAGEDYKTKRFNDGICIYCSENLKPFGVDKFGNIVWLCDACGYNFVD